MNALQRFLNLFKAEDPPEKTLNGLCEYIADQYPTIVQTIAEFKIPDVKEFMVQSHHGMGRFLRNELQLWSEGSKVVAFFGTTYGVYHPVDISTILLKKLFFIHNNAWVLEDAQQYKEYWTAMEQNKGKNEYTVDFKGTKIKVQVVSFPSSEEK
jgi:hypothetical protein